MASERSSSDLGTIIVAGAVGAAVGAVVALMLAPKPGGELRAELGEKAKDYAEIAKERAAQVASRAREKVAEFADNRGAAKAGDEAEPEAEDA